MSVFARTIKKIMTDTIIGALFIVFFLPLLMMLVYIGLHRQENSLCQNYITEYEHYGHLDNYYWTQHQVEVCESVGYTYNGAIKN